MLLVLPRCVSPQNDVPPGAAGSFEADPDLRLTLVGPAEEVEPFAAAHDRATAQVATEVIEMGEATLRISSKRCAARGGRVFRCTGAAHPALSAQPADTVGVEHPKVGLLNIGEEDTKGDLFAQEAHRLLTEAVPAFAGNCEGGGALVGEFHGPTLGGGRMGDGREQVLGVLEGATHNLLGALGATSTWWSPTGSPAMSA